MAQAIKPQLLRTVCLCLVLAGLSAQASGKDEFTLYKYINESGTEVRSSTLPPEYAQNGYEIISLSGDVLKVVPPAPKAEDLEQAERERKTLANYHLLKQRFSTVDEINSAKARRITNLQTNIQILQGNIQTIQTKIDELIRDAAGFERGGREVPDSIKAQLAGAKQELKVSKELLEYREEELTETSKKFDENISAYIRGAKLEKRINAAQQEKQSD